MDKKLKSIKVNFLMNAILNMSSLVFPLITFPYISRVLSPVGYGKFSFANSVISYFAILAQLGIPTYGIRACAKVRDNKEKLSKTVCEILLINIVICLFAYMMFFCALFLVPKFRADKDLFLVMSLSILFNTIGVEWLYKALENYTYITVRSIVFKFIAVIAMFIMVREQKDYVMYGGISILASSGSYVLNFLYLPQIISVRSYGRYDLKKHLKPVMIFFAMSCATTIYVHLDAVMLGFMKTDADVGYYSVAIKTKMILVSVITSLGAVLLPRASYYIEHKMEHEFHKILKKALNFVLLVSLPLTIYFMIYSKEGIIFLAGSEYSDSVIPMMVIMMTVPLIGMTNVMGIQTLVPLGKEKYVLYSEIVGAVVDLILNMLLIPVMASTGAAIGTLAAETAVWCVQYLVLRKTVDQAFKSVHYGSVAVAIVLSSVAAVAIKLTGLTNIALLVLSSIIFWGIYGGVLTVFREPLLCELEGLLLDKFFNYKKVED